MAPDTELSGICACFTSAAGLPPLPPAKSLAYPAPKRELTNPDTTRPAPPTSSSPELHNAGHPRRTTYAQVKTTTTPLRATLRALQASPTFTQKI